MMPCRNVRERAFPLESKSDPCVLTDEDSRGILLAWQQILSNLASHSHALETLLVFLRRGLARHLREDAEEQARVILHLEDRIRDVARQGTRLCSYTETNFGATFGARTWPGIIESLLSPIERLAMRWPSLAVVVVNACDRASLELLELSLTAARRCGFTQLQFLLDSMRTEVQGHIEGDLALIRRFPIEGRLCRWITMVVMTLWVWDLSGILGRRLDRRARSALASIGISGGDVRMALNRIARESREQGEMQKAAWRESA